MAPVLDFGERLALRRARSHTPLQDLARELAADANELGSVLTQLVLDAEERLTDAEDPTLAGLAERFVRSTAGAMISALAYGVPMEAARPTDASMALFERLAERDDGLAVALRAQRVLGAQLWQLWSTFTDQRVADRAAHSRLLAESTRLLAAYTDCVSESLTAAWDETRRRRRRGIDIPVEELVNRALFGDQKAALDALEQLAYPAGALHVAVRLPEPVDRDGLENLARRMKLACGVAVLAAGATVWVGLTRASSAEDVRRARPLVDLEGPIGLGEPARGLEGFRRTYEQAADALRVAGLNRSEGITRYRDVALLAVLSADETRARELAEAELGALAGDDEVAVRLRETISAYLTSGESQVATAQQLYVHEKTVKYRLRQAEELLGHRISERRSELAAALMVHRAFTK